MGIDKDFLRTNFIYIQLSVLVLNTKTVNVPTCYVLLCYVYLLKRTEDCVKLQKKTKFLQYPVFDKIDFGYFVIIWKIKNDIEI